MTLTVLDPGPIPLASIERYDDPDTETAMAHGGGDPTTAHFRLVEISLTELEDVKWLPGPMKWSSRITDALIAGSELPPVVIVASDRWDDLFGLLDGLNRTHAHWALGRPTIRAYELLDRRRR